MPELDDFSASLKKAKARLLQMHFEAKIGHIGGNLSALDAMLYLHLRRMGPQDQFVLSKGHSAGALYICLWMKGSLSDAELTTFHKDQSRLAGHPMAAWNEGIRFSTGSLGHGLGLAAGTALGMKMQGKAGHVYCLMSDGEWQEGSNWEALIFAAHHKLDNLTLLIDFNGLQGFGSTSEIASMGDLPLKIKGFGVQTLQLDGHDPAALKAALDAVQGGPKALVLNTVKGKGVSFMEGRMEWHYLAMDEKQYRQALQELG